jgi:hypothetical protein
MPVKVNGINERCEMSRDDIMRQAKLLAKENRKAEPQITRIYWFPDDIEVRLIEVLPPIPPNGDQTVRPYFFRPSPNDNLPAPSGVVLIRPEEERQVHLPADWGRWSDAIGRSTASL